MTGHRVCHALRNDSAPQSHDSGRNIVASQQTIRVFRPPPAGLCRDESIAGGETGPKTPCRTVGQLRAPPHPYQEGVGIPPWQPSGSGRNAATQRPPSSDPAASSRKKRRRAAHEDRELQAQHYASPPTGGLPCASQATTHWGTRGRLTWGRHTQVHVGPRGQKKQLRWVTIKTWRIWPS